ncbi:hypothetical protein [Vreelandella massiliensis]|uniref:hypothetical protein n=1 Tax=Vreelandella massiliensis TaxID=1816686 RepID=UPI00096AC644|nr:hypothetical protein [Halomonas massiliensis]
MAQIFLNNCYATLAQAITATDTQIELSGMNGFPGSLAAGDFFLLTLYADTTRYGENIEVVKVTGVGATSVTVERGFEGSAVAHDALERAEARLTAASLEQMEVPWDQVTSKPGNIAYQGTTQDVTFRDVDARWVRAEGRKPATDPNDSNNWDAGLAVIEHITEGWAPEDYMGVLHASISVNRAFQLAVGSGGIYVRRLHSSLTNAPWQYMANQEYVDNALGDKRGISDTSFPRYDLASADTTATLDLAQQQIFRVDASSSRTLAFANEPGADRAMTVVVHITGNSAVTWPAGIDWDSDAAPELGDNETKVVLFWDGIEWSGFVRVAK